MQVKTMNRPQTEDDHNKVGQSFLLAQVLVNNVQTLFCGTIQGKHGLE